ncbi:Multidrug resistance protein MdtA [Faecalibacterium prausnitzii]|nr:HlyD family efflux transporter periplasmic adaptor subunit [Faecalibacterium prausnitzii]VUW96882.1 Multidrug resistance protein MdtA [Faecalibacterium prausnitzii]
MKPFIQKHWKPITAAICAAAVAAAVLVPKNSAKPAAASAQYVETRPEKRNIVNSYSADGTITAADTYTVKPMVKGTVLTADFEVGDMASSVEKAQLSLEQAQSSYDDAVDAQYIRSSVRGTVSSLKVKAGDVVSAGQEVAVVRDDSTLLLTLDFPAADAITYFVGQSVDVTIDGTFETTTSTIQSISGADSLSSGNLAVRSVVIAVQNPGTLNTTMSGTASINGVSAMSSAHFTCQYEQTITATASGTIIAKDVKVGDTVGSISSTTETMCVINDLSYLEMPLDVDELDILDIAVGQKAEITADAIDDCTFEGVVTNISSAGTTTGSTTTYPVTIRIDDTGSLMPGMNATAALDIPPCRRYVIVKATAGFAVFRLILKSLLFYSCLDFTQNLGKTHFV